MLIVRQKNIKNASKLLEQDLKINLPTDYAVFLDKYNGGATYNTKVKINRKWDEIDGFNGVGELDGSYSFEAMKSMGVLDRFLEDKMLPIANNDMGDCYCLSLREEEFGSIYIVFHDLMSKKKMVFSNFTDFIAHTKSDPIGYIASMEEREATAIANGYGAKIEKLRPIWQKEIDKFSHITQEEVIL